MEKVVDENYVKDINCRSWTDISYADLKLIVDKNKRIDYQKHTIFCVKNIINPLCMGLGKKVRVDFPSKATELICREMVEELKSYYYGHNYTREQVAGIIVERHKKR